jgi:hypothetical protein
MCGAIRCTRTGRNEDEVKCEYLTLCLASIGCERCNVFRHHKDRCLFQPQIANPKPTELASAPHELCIISGLQCGLTGEAFVSARRVKATTERLYIARSAVV